MPVQTPLGQFDVPIVLVRMMEESQIGVMTASHDFFLYNFQTQSSEKLLHLNVPEDAEFLYALDPAGKRLLFGSIVGDNLHMIDLQNKKTLKRFDLDHQAPTSIAFSPDGAYLVCGTDQGRVLLWRSDSSTLVARLHSFPEYTSFYVKPTTNFVSALSFHENLLATSGYGGSVIVTNYQTQTSMKRFHPGLMKNTALLFYEDTVIVGNEEGTLFKIDRLGKHPMQRLPTGLGSITSLMRIGPDPYVLVVADQPYASLINARTMKVVNERYLQFDHNITSVCKDARDDLYIGTKGGELHHCDLQPLNQLEAMILSKAYSQAYRYCEQEPLLIQSESYRQLEAIYQQTVENAKIALEQGQKEQANAMLAPFASVKSKEITELQRAYGALTRLQYLYDNRRFPPFYGLAEQYPLLQSTSLYQYVEKIWTEHFLKAQRLMLLGKVKEAKAEVEPFALVNGKRRIIELLIHHIEVFKAYSKAVQQRDYSVLNQLTQRYSILRQLPSYQQLIDDAGELSDAIFDALKSKSFEQAELFLNQLKEVIQYAEQYAHLKIFFGIAAKLSHAIDHRRLRTAYQLIDTHHELTVLPWAEELENEWQKKLLHCESFAARGDIRSIKRELGLLINLHGRHERIGDIFRMAYQVQLKLLLHKKSPEFSASVGNYCDIFGIDTETRALLKKAKHLDVRIDLDPIRLYPKKRDSWLSFIRKLPDTITPVLQ